MKRIELPSSTASLFIPNCPSQGSTFLLTDIWERYGQVVAVIIGETLSEAETKCEDIAALSEAIHPNEKIDFHCFDKTPNPDHPDSFDRTCERLSLLSALRRIDELKENDSRVIVATTFDALLGPCPIIEDAQKSEIVVRPDSDLSFDKFCEDIANQFDYCCEVVCEEPGQFAIRGGLVDIYPVNANFPVRIDFFGDHVEEIRSFDPTSQRSEGRLTEVRISSIGNEQSKEREGEFFRYLPRSVLWFFEEPENLLRLSPYAFHQSENKALKKANFSDAWSRGENLNDFFLSTSEINVGSGIFNRSNNLLLKLSPLLKELDQFNHNSLNISLGAGDKKQTKAILERLEKYSTKGYKLVIAVGVETEKKRILSILADHGLERMQVSFFSVALHDGFLYEKREGNEILSTFLEDGQSGLLLATSREILGRERSRRPIRSRKAQVQRKEVDQALDFTDLVDGDLLVHLQHGICRFSSMGKIEQDGKSEEAITVEFADGILLHVPLQESHLLSRYVGLRKAKPKLAKLGGRAWAKTKEAAELAAIDLAADLLRLQAARDSDKGYAFSPDDQWQKEFEDSFPYTETPDQLRSIAEVKEDMESEKPMDRLVCGDVGYGKTEIAMRAAFKGMMDGKQVALLAPTTILCQQHLQTFMSRMSDFPVTIEMLSRFRTSAQQRKIIDSLKLGSLDMVIGTHRMFSADLEFRDLGLLIVDEEQRFGVEHKEQLKKLKANVDVLTLSATPIPRTLYFAMVGVRSFSTIETAPTNRRPIRTEIVKGSDDILKKAIALELRRGGQAFYLHNRVKTIHSVTRRLQSLFPKLRIAVGHGQMGESELEEVMVEFIEGKYDLLICTTIIESGLDIPNCNTIIIEEADKFGLSQLYQLRGRVGRFTRQAYAYLLVNPLLPIKDMARKRLSALRSTSSLGAGFKIALRDLELRGAGNLLGSEQSGHIAGVGFEMYCKLLRESVSRLKGDENALRPTAVVRMDFLHTDDSLFYDEQDATMASCFPAAYISEPRLRIECYRKIASIVKIEEITTYEEELRDRFGPIPDQTRALFYETEIKCLGQEAGFDSISSKENELFCREVKKSSRDGVKYLKKMGRIPRLNEKLPLLKLKEIIRFLKIHIHGIKHVS